MLEQIDFNTAMGKAEYKELAAVLLPEFSRLQRELKAAGIPTILLFEGLDGAGKGRLINQLIHPLDPRGFTVTSTERPYEEEKRRPYLWRYYQSIPSAGRITIFDRGWYTRVQLDQFHGKLKGDGLEKAFFEIETLEQQLSDAGYLIIKFFLAISKEEQWKRFQKLEEDEASSWRVSKKDWKRNKKYEKFWEISDNMLERTHTPDAPWTVVNSMDFEFAAAQILSVTVSRVKAALEKKNTALQEKARRPKSTVTLKRVTGKPLSQADLTLTLSKKEYKEQLQILQDKLTGLHNVLYQKKIPVVLAFEGWDAGGKGGAIKRLTQALDPRGYQVHPVSAPTATENSFHYLHRFWTKMPKTGHIAIFDRSWYGRVMVERIEGFCKTDEWKRAYKEINDMERILADEGCIIRKFWLHIDRDEQERRFLERQQNPEKQWKITEEDWRNREKWGQYETAVNEMILRTSTDYAPWIIVEGNSKQYARIKVLRAVVDAIEETTGCT